MRWLLAIATVIVCGMIVLATHRPGSDPTTVASLGLMASALAAYAVMAFPLVGAAILGVLVLLSLGWGWFAAQQAALGAEVTLCVLLLGVVGWRRQQWATRVRHLRQVLEDLEEEQVVKEQAVALSQQTRGALQKKHGRYLQLQSIAEQLSRMTDLRSVAKLAVEQAFELIGKSDVCLLFLVDPSHQELSLIASQKHPSVTTVQAKHGDQFDRYVLRTQRPLLVNDVRRDFRFTVSLPAGRQISSVIACPILLGRHAEGVLRLDSSKPSAYSQDDLRFLDILLDLVATAVTNARLFAQTQQLAMTDGLTGLMLRRPFMEQLVRELARTSRKKEPVSVLMLDVDRFKSYNDEFGHTAGDLVLKSLAEILKAVVPPDGFPARYGGEEFAVLLPKTSREQAAALAERIRDTIERGLEVSQWGGGRPVTASIGLASYPDDAKADLELIRIADQRLYHAKHQGRNLVCSSS